MSHLVPIEYIGSKDFKRDSVLHTKRVWNGKGDVVEVPDADAPRYLAYKDIWRVHKPGAAPVQAQQRDATPAIGKRRLKAIRDAIDKLDPKDDEDYKDGNPILARVVELFNGPVTEDEVQQALALTK